MASETSNYSTGTWRAATKHLKLITNTGLDVSSRPEDPPGRKAFLKDLAKASRKVTPQAKKRALKSR
jgi:hypothetical protein